MQYLNVTENGRHHQEWKIQRHRQLGMQNTERRQTIPTEKHNTKNKEDEQHVPGVKQGIRINTDRG